MGHDDRRRLHQGQPSAEIPRIRPENLKYNGNTTLRPPCAAVSRPIMRNMETAILCNVQSLARRLGLPRRWLVAEAEAGRLPVLRVDGKLIFNIEAVRRVLAERAGQPATTFGARCEVPR